MSSEIHVGDIGTAFVATVMDGTSVVDVSSATVKQIYMQKPDGASTVLTKDCLFYTDGTDGKIIYTTVAGDLDTAGVWRMQAFVTLTSGSWHSDIISVRVHPNLA